MFFVARKYCRKNHVNTLFSSMNRYHNINIIWTKNFVLHISTTVDNNEQQLYETSQTIVPTDRKFQVTNVLKDGTLEGRELSRHDIVSEFGMQSRDLRLLDVHHRSLASILVRPGGLIVHMEGLRMVIGSEKCLLVSHQKVPDTFLPTLQNKLLGTPSETPFEFIVLEKILQHTCDSLNRRFVFLAEPLSQYLEAVQQKYTVGRYGQIFPYRQSLAAYELRLREVENVLKDLLADDEDMAMTYLTHRKRTGEARPVHDHWDIEMLLETYLGQVELLRNRVDSIKEKVEITEEQLQIDLDRLRNDIMKANLLLSVGTFTVGSGALLAGFLGMNLTNYMETNPNAFACITLGVTTLVCTTSWGLYRLARTKRLL